MSSTNPVNHQQDQEEAINAARTYIRKYERDAIKFLLNHDPVRLLKDACAVDSVEYHDTMAKGKKYKYDRTTAQEPDSEDDKKSQSSRRRTMSSNSRSALTSASSAAVSSLGSGDDRCETLWIALPDGDHTTLKAARLDRSNYLVQINVVQDHLKMSHGPTPRDSWVRYKGGTIKSLGTISLDWAWSWKGLQSKQARGNTFHVVEDLPSDAVIPSDSELQDNAIVQRSRDFETGRNTRPNAFGVQNMDEEGLSPNSHGLNLQQSPFTHSFTENSTAATARQNYSRAGQSTRERRPSSNADSSRIPVRRTSGSAFGAASDTSQPQTAIGRSPPLSTRMPPSPPSQPGLISGFSVTMLFKKQQCPFKLELDASGAGFYECLSHRFKKLVRRELNRQSDSVYFSRHKDSRDEGCLVTLEEDQVEIGWNNAVSWLTPFAESHRKSPIYAFIETDDDV